MHFDASRRRRSSGLTPSEKLRCGVELMESRVLLSADPAALAADGFVPITWNGQNTFAKAGSWIVRLDGLAGQPGRQLGAANALLAKGRDDVRADRYLGNLGKD